MSAEQVELVHRWFEQVWNRGRLEAVDEMLSADAVGHGLGAPGVEVRGPEGFKPIVTQFRGAFPDVEMTVEQTITEGEWIATRWSARATHGGDGLGLRPTGLRITTTGMSMARVRDGQFVEVWGNWDMFGLLQQIDASPGLETPVPEQKT